FAEAGLSLQRGEIPGLPGGTTAARLGPLFSLLGDRVIDHRHGRHPPLSSRRFWTLLGHSSRVDRDIGAGLPVGVFMPGPGSRRTEGISLAQSLPDVGAYRFRQALHSRFTELQS